MVFASLPRRLSSLHFGIDTLDISTLKRYYLCEDLDRRNPAFFDEMLKRMSSLIIDGVKFPLPRRLKEQIFYEKVPDEKGCMRLRKIPLYAMALHYKRVRDMARFDAELRQNSQAYANSLDYRRINEVLLTEKIVDEGRECRAETRLQKQRSTDSY